MRRPPRLLLAALALVVALAVLAPASTGPGVVGRAAAQSTPGSASVVPSGSTDRAKADELRGVARDALRRENGGDVDLDGSLLGIGGVVWRILLVVLIGVAVVVGVALVRRGPRRRRRAGTAPPVGADGLDDLERQAVRAEQDGEHRAAVVLWFRVGARRIGERLSTAADETATAGQVARASGDPRVRSLALDHDRVAYGPGPVGPDDSRGAREGWRTVLREPAEPAGEDPR